VRLPAVGRARITLDNGAIPGLIYWLLGPLQAWSGRWHGKRAEQLAAAATADDHLAEQRAGVHVSRSRGGILEFEHLVDGRLEGVWSRKAFSSFEIAREPT
jgi:hypothetical protein